MNTFNHVTDVTGLPADAGIDSGWQANDECSSDYHGSATFLRSIFQGVGISPRDDDLPFEAPFFHGHGEVWDVQNHYQSTASDIPQLCINTAQTSRAVQRAIRSGTTRQRGMILALLVPNAVEIMTDIYGNHVIQTVLQYSTEPDKQELTNIIQVRILDLSEDPYGCRVVQAALEHGSAQQRSQLVASLKPFAVTFARDPNASHVLQKAVQYCPGDAVSGLASVLSRYLGQLSKDRYGYRVVQHCLERTKCPLSRTVALELFESLESLITHKYGNFVAQHIAQYATGRFRGRLFYLVATHMARFSRDKYGSNVVERCLEKATNAWRLKLAFSADQDTLRAMVNHRYGNYVLRKFRYRLFKEKVAYSPYRENTRHPLDGLRGRSLPLYEDVTACSPPSGNRW